MDSAKIDEINRYNQRGKIEHSPVILKKRKNEIAELYVITLGCTKDEYMEIKKTGELHTSLLLQLKGINLPEDGTTDSLIYLGDLTAFKAYAMFVYQFPQRKIDIRNRLEPQYRLYTKTLEDQKATNCYIRNLCSSARESWQSVIKKVGSNYGIVFTYKVLLERPRGITITKV